MRHAAAVTPPRFRRLRSRLMGPFALVTAVVLVIGVIAVVVGAARDPAGFAGSATLTGDGATSIAAGLPVTTAAAPEPATAFARAVVAPVATTTAAAGRSGAVRPPGCGVPASCATVPVVVRPGAPPTAPRTPSTPVARPLPPAPAAGSPPAAAPGGGTVVCGKFGSTPVEGGRYEVQNDVWGSNLPQCVRAFDTGFEVQDAQFTNTAAPAAYPSIFAGCNHGTCTAGTSLPRQVGALPSVTSSWSFSGTRPDERWDAAYDIWFDPTPRRDGTVTGAEMMIWLDAAGPKPIGQRSGTVQLAGTSWDVWRGVNGAQVVSYVAATPTHRVQDLPLSDFFADAVSRGIVRSDWYLTSVQAGFEPWTGGAGMATTAFSVTGVTTG